MKQLSSVLKINREGEISPRFDWRTFKKPRPSYEAYKAACLKLGRPVLRRDIWEARP